MNVTCYLPLLDLGNDARGGRTRTRTENDGSANTFTEHRVGNGHGRGVADPVVLIQGVLDFDRCNLDELVDSTS